MVEKSQTNVAYFAKQLIVKKELERNENMSRNAEFLSLYDDLLLLAGQ